MALSERIYTGSSVHEIITQLGALRIQVFYDFPYLYEGSQSYEEDYLKIYTTSEKSIVFGIFDGETLVGATTGMPLSLEDKAIQEPFLKDEDGIDSYFYFGESILLPAYRGLGLGHRFFDVREEHAKNLGYKHTIFCSVVRPDKHTMKPLDYRPNDAFWLKRGYEKLPTHVCLMSWLDRTEKEASKKELVFWRKTWK